MSDDAVRRLKDRGMELLSKGKLPAALEAYRAVVKAVPADLAARQKVAEILARQGLTAAAVAEYTEVVKRYAENGLFFKASALCRVVLTLDPKNQAAQDALAGLYAQRREAPAMPKVPLPKSAPLERSVLTAPPPPPPAAVEEEVVSIEIDLDDLGFQPEPPPPPRESLPRIPLFSSLTGPELGAVLRDAMEVRAFSAGDDIVREGEPGEVMYALAEGQVGVLRGERQVATMDEGSFFGEMALMSGAPRLATVRALTDVVALEFSRQKMDELVERYPNVRSGLEQFFRERLLLNLMRSNPLLQPLDDAARARLSSAFQSCTFKPKETILEQGRTGEAVYLLLRGRCAVFHRESSAAPYPDLIEGDAFGEISVVLDQPVTATVQAREVVVTLRVSAEDFRAIVMAEPAVKARVLELATERLNRTARLTLLPPDDLRV